MSNFWKTTLEAAVWTFVEAFVASFALAAPVLKIGDYTSLQAAATAAGLAGLAALVSFLKSVIVRNIGAEDSPFVSGQLAE